MFGLAAAPAAAQGGPWALVRACRPDYQRFCPGMRPGGGAIRACLGAHAAELSAPCRNAALAERARRTNGGGTRVTLPAGATVVRNVAYGPDPAQRMDVYQPPHSRDAPVIFMVHGGAWMIGDKAAADVIGDKPAHWLPQGYIFISVNYRMLPAADPLQQAEDVAKALAVAQAKARSWGGDPGRFVLLGHSAGAHLVALLTADPAIAAREGAKPWLGTVALDSAAYDVVRIMERRHFPFYDRAFGASAAFWRRVSPLDRLTAEPRPMLLVCSSLRADSCAQAHAFADKSVSEGGSARVLAVSMTHMAIDSELGLPGPYTQAVDSFLHALGLPHGASQSRN